jgi:predicted ATPase/class 3 adenylate cyclase
MAEYPAGTVTFLFTDVEKSTSLWERDSRTARAIVEHYLAIVHQAVETNGGVHFKTIGDGTQSAFSTAADGLAAALAAQQALLEGPWPDAATRPKVRMALHAGAAEPHDGDYLAPCLNRLARLLEAAHGEQILLSQTIAGLAGDDLPAQVTLASLGEFRLRDILQPEEVFQLRHPALRAEFPPLNAPGDVPHNLPTHPTPFLGREREVEELIALLLRPEVRLVTLTGSGGVGKTRLALRVAAESLESFSDGVFVIDLAALSDHTLVPSATATALGLHEQPGQTMAETLAAHLRDRHVLLLFDNFEHLLAAATLVSDLIAAAPHMKVLATSRSRLGLQAEHEYGVETLPVPDLTSLPPLAELQQYDAIALFVARARALRSDFALTAENAAAVAAICARVDGLPLAIELAAARVKLLPPRALLDRLEDRLATLTGGARDLPARQRTVRATIAWSYGLLTPEETTLFRRLSVFVGGWTLAGAEAIAAVEAPESIDALSALSGLVDQNLVDERPRSPADQPRYGMLETIREFASEQLVESGESDAIERAFEAFLIDLATAAETELQGSAQPLWLDRLEADHDNMRAALRTILERGDGAMALRLASRLWRFWKWRGHPNEGRSWLERSLAAAGGTNFSGRPAAEYGLGELSMEIPDLEAAAMHYKASLELSEQQRDRLGIAIALNGLLIVAVNRYDYTEARELGERALRLRRELGDERGVAVALSGLAMVAREEGDLERAANMYEASLALWRRRDEPIWLAATLQALGITRRMTGDQQAARTLLGESQALQERLGDHFGLGVTAIECGHLARQEGDFPSAATEYTTALRQFTSVGANLGAVEALEWLAATAVDRGEAAQALRFFGATEAARRALSLPPPAASDAPILTEKQKQAALAAGMDRAADGQALSLDKATAEALRAQLSIGAVV